MTDHEYEDDGPRWAHVVMDSETHEPMLLSDETLAELREATYRPQTYWIESDIYYCPICGSEDKLSERIYDRSRPKEWADRNHIIEKWDYCDAF